MPRFLRLLILPACFLQILCFADVTKPDVIAQTASLIRAGKVKQAEALLRSALAAHPNSASLHGALGELLLSEHEYKDAALELGQAVQQNPESRKYNLLAAEALIGGERYTTAVDFLKAIRPRFGNDFMLHYELGLAFYYESNINAAQAELEESLRLSPNFDRAKFLLANCLGYGDLAKAIDITRKLAKEHPGNSFYWAALGQMLGQAGNGTEAVRAIRRALTASPNDSFVQFSAATVFVKTGDYSSGRPLLEHLEEANPKLVDVHVLLVRVYTHSGERDRARKETEIVKQLRKEEAAGQSLAPPQDPGSSPEQQ